MIFQQAHAMQLSPKQVQNILTQLVQVLDKPQKGNELLRLYNNETLRALEEQIDNDMIIGQESETTTSVIQVRSLDSLFTGLLMKDFIATELKERETGKKNI